MLNLRQINETKDYYSGTASNIARQISFAGLALLWIFKSDTEGTYQLPEELRLSAGLLVLALLLDFLQYVAGYFMYAARLTYLERKKGVDAEKMHKNPSWMNYPGVAFFWGKLASVFFAYVSLLSFLYDVIKWNS